MSEQQFARLREMAPNWDSYGADAPKPATVDRAHAFWRQLPSPDDWQVVPCSDGSIQIEQHRDGFDIEIIVSPATQLETKSGDSHG